MNAKINTLELASNLAMERIALEWNESMGLAYSEQENGDLLLSDTAQDMFIEYYEQYLDIIDSVATPMADGTCLEWSADDYDSVKGEEESLKLSKREKLDAISQFFERNGDQIIEHITELMNKDL